MTDSVTARIVDARTLLSRAAQSLPESEAKHAIYLALAACGDALEAHKGERE